MLALTMGRNNNKICVPFIYTADNASCCAI